MADLGFIVAAQVLGGFDASVLPMRHDIFADYYKFILSMPGGGTVVHSVSETINEIVRSYQGRTDYMGIGGIAAGHLTHLHVTPLTMVFCQLNLRMMAWIDPVGMLAILIVGLGAWWIALATRYASDSYVGMIWALTGLCCYPAALMVSRGNVYAGAAGLLIIHAMLMARCRRRNVVPAVLLALACCIRPNAVIFIGPLLLFTPGRRVRALTCFAVTVTGASLVSLLIAHWLYPDYSFTSFRQALAVYYQVYVRDGLGGGYGSSAYGGLKLVLGSSPQLETLAVLPAALIGLATMGSALRRQLQPSSLLFLTGATYALGSTIFGDYHLLTFLLPPMLLAAELPGGRLDDRGRAILIASCLVLAPKNLTFPDAWSWQEIANPLIMIAASIQILVAEWRGASPLIEHRLPGAPSASARRRSPWRREARAG